MYLDSEEIIGIVFVLLVSVASVSVFVASMWNCKLKFSGTVWGIKVPATRAQRSFLLRNRILLVLSLIAAVVVAPMCFMSLLSLLFTSFSSILIYIAAWFGCGILSGYIAYKKSQHSPLLEKENNAAVLGSLPVFKSIEAQLDNATHFVVSYEGIALIDHMNYCYALERYEDHRMGSLTSYDEVAMVGMYFVQKYHEKFNYKVDMEVIPGTPGQTVTVIGSGGVNYAFIEGVPDKRIFRSYIFTRK